MTRTNPDDIRVTSLAAKLDDTLTSWFNCEIEHSEASNKADGIQDELLELLSEGVEFLSDSELAMAEFIEAKGDVARQVLKAGAIIRAVQICAASRIGGESEETVRRFNYRRSSTTYGWLSPTSVV